MLIRAFADADWQQVWPFFDEVVAEEEAFALPRGLTSERALRAWVEPPPGCTVVAVEDERVLGTARAAPNLPGPGAHVATAGVVVAPHARGRGVGRALAEHVLAAAREQGFLAMQFNAVVETNAPAVALWQSLGFSIVGTVPEAFEHPVHGLVGLHVMHRRL